LADGIAILRDLYKTGGHHMSETTVPVRDSSRAVWNRPRGYCDLSRHAETFQALIIRYLEAKRKRKRRIRWGV